MQSDRKDKSAAGWEEHEQLQQHESQKGSMLLMRALSNLCISDYKKGFGGQFGVQSDRKDKSAAGWEEHEQLQQHESQTGTYLLVPYSDGCWQGSTFAKLILFV